MASDDVLERADAYVEQFADRSDAMPLIRDLAAELRALRKDRERLDFVENVCPGLSVEYSDPPKWTLRYENEREVLIYGSGDSLRTAIDSAMAKEAGE